MIPLYGKPYLRHLEFNHQIRLGYIWITVTWGRYCNKKHKVNLVQKTPTTTGSAES